MDDTELHERLIMLDPSALSEWEAAHRPAVVGWLVRGGLAPSDAEEVWNDVFAATINAAPNLVPRGPSLRRYAFKVARNLRADRLAAAARMPMDRLDPDADPGAPDPNRLAVDERRVTAMRACLERCPERYRVVVELAETGHDVDDLARLLGVERESVYQIRHRARLWLQHCIGEAVR